MNAYEITNTISGAYIGVYEGETPEEALDAMARDAVAATLRCTIESC